MRRALVAAVLGSLLLVVSPAPAYAHADLVRSTPANGSVLATAPSTIRLAFSEPVTLEESRLVDSSGAAIPSRAAVDGAVVTLVPEARLPSGIVTATYSITSDDGHQVDGALAFVIGKPATRGAAQRIVTAPSVPTVLNGSHPGPFTVALAHRATSGEVTWTSPQLTGSFTWPVHARGKSAEAHGVLPFAGTWTMRATLIGAKSSVIVTTGTATLNP